MSASNESHSAVRRGVSIRAHFTLPAQEACKAASAADYMIHLDSDNDADTDTTTIIQHNLDERTCSPARLGLPEHEEPQKVRYNCIIGHDGRLLRDSSASILNRWCNTHRIICIPSANLCTSSWLNHFFEQLFLRINNI
jgi:hypothetical protein